MQVELGRIEKKQNSAQKIQKLWRSYTNRKIYKYYKDIIMFKCKGVPSKLLKGINPNQAQLLQTAVDCHVRFRLGGDNFPPNIYYKIFSKKNVCDINSFAPRDYSSLPRDTNDVNLHKISHKNYQHHHKDYESQGWYLRSDNNGWRPISHKMLIKTDYIELYSEKKVNFYHHKIEIRTQKYNKKHKLARLKWMKNLYIQGKSKQKQKQLQQVSKQQQKLQKLQINNKYQKNKQQQFDSDEKQFQNEVQDLIEWSENLNFDTYVQDWYQLSTSQSSSNFVPRFINNQKYNLN